MSRMPTFRSALKEFKARPEHELLLLCGRAEWSAQEEARLRSLAGADLDGEYLLRITHRHRMLPLLWRHLSEACPDALPPGIMSEISRCYQDHLRFSLTAARELLRILAELARHGVDALPFKGPVLAQSVYGDLVLRQFQDIDLFVRPQDAPRAKLVLDGMGFPFRWGPSPVREAAVLKSRCRHYQIFREDPSLDLDLHWDLFSPTFRVSFSPNGLFERSRPVLLGGVEVRTFGTEDLLLFLCAHSGKHSFDCLLWIVDIAEILRSEQEADWVRLYRRAEEMGIERIFSASLLLAAELLEAPLPEGVRSRLGNREAVDSLAAHALRVSFHTPSDEQEIPVKLRFRFSARERWLDRARDGFQSLAALLTPTPLEWDAVPLPDRLFFLYYLFRPVRLVGKYARRLARRSEAA